MSLSEQALATTFVTASSLAKLAKLEPTNSRWGIEKIGNEIEAD
jgi:hypothetical protein